MAARSRFKAKKEKGNKLWTSWEKYKSASTESLERSINKKFATLSEAVCAQIKVDAARFSRLGDSDEEIYTHLTALMGVYRRVMELAAGFSFDDPAVNALIEGICEVLSSRLREFSGEAGDDDSGNPVKAEKSIILAEALEKTTNLINDLKENFATGLRDDDNAVWDESYEMILRGDFYHMYSLYREGLKICLSRLDDLHSRKTARFYTELIEREYEELGNIIKLQKVDEPTGLDEQSLTVYAILDALNEAYQATEPIIKNFQTLQNAPPQKPASTRSFDDFENELISLLDVALPQPPERKNFFDVLDAEAENLFDGIEIDYKRAVYSLQRLISAEVLLAEEITGVFVQALRKLNIEGEGIERDILAGIKETIEIKISGLQESIQSFSRKSGDILKNFSAEKSNSDEREKILEEIRSAWMESPPEANKLSEFFESCEEIFAPCRERIKKQVDVYTEILEKSSFRFKKEVLLYEICTFEEILIHSVSRLRDSKNIAVFVAAQMLDSAFRELEIILKKNNIAVIRPAVKEIFNAKEHEVLVAEKQEGFEKGEIIKIITAGYRFKEQVILRANIIAAR